MAASADEAGLLCLLLLLLFFLFFLLLFLGCVGLILAQLAKDLEVWTLVSAKVRIEAVVNGHDNEQERATFGLWTMSEKTCLTRKTWELTRREVELLIFANLIIRSIIV